jgi:hypothetical protein
MEELFLPYEEALTLKELGFDKTCFASYGIKLKSGKEIPTLYGCGVIFFDKDDFITQKTSNILCSTPTFSQAFRWFREKHKLEGFVKPNKGKLSYSFSINSILKNSSIIFSFHRWSGYKKYNTHEEAELECLKKLIEIVKTK